MSPEAGWKLPTLELAAMVALVATAPCPLPFLGKPLGSTPKPDGETYAPFVTPALWSPSHPGHRDTSRPYPCCETHRSPSLRQDPPPQLGPPTAAGRPTPSCAQFWLLMKEQVYKIFFDTIKKPGVPAFSACCSVLN